MTTSKERRRFVVRCLPCICLSIQVELQRLLGMSVDVLTPRALPEAFRNRVLSEAMPV
jgi:predicted nucleotidyltransferase